MTESHPDRLQMRVARRRLVAFGAAGVIVVPVRGRLAAHLPGWITPRQSTPDGLPGLAGCLTLVAVGVLGVRVGRRARLDR